MLPLRLLAVLVPTTALLALPGVANAERLVTADAAADAQSVRSDVDEDVFTPAPEHTDADITRTVVSHGARRLTVQVRFRDLDRSLPSAAYVKLRTPARRFDIQASRNTPEADIRLTERQREDVVECRGLRQSVDGAREQLTISVPAACLGGPTWVRVGVLSLAVELVPGSEELYDTYFDDANMTGGFEDEGIRLGQKVFAD